MERLIITINPDETITAYIGIGYQGEASEFSWLLPVPNTPQVDVAETTTMDELEKYTRRRFDTPDLPCSGVIWTEFEGAGGGGGPGSVQEGSVGPYDYAILDDRDGAVIVAWLEGNGYLVPDEAVAIIDDYASSGLQFLAMKLKPTAQVGDIQPVKITFSGTKPVIPIKLMKIASLNPLPILVWIFADTQYVPENYALPAVDYSGFDSHINFAEMRRYELPNTMYQRALDDIQWEYDGRAFVTEYAAPTQTLQATLGTSKQDAGLLELLNNYAYVTRLRAQLSPEQMTTDVAFIPAFDVQDDSSTIDLGDYLDPIDYWGCSTPARLNDGASETLTATAIVDETPLWLPSDWQQSQLLLNLTPVRVYSPQTVTADTLRAYFNGETTPPMLVMFRAITGGTPADWALIQLLGIDYPSNLDASHVWRSETLYQPFVALEKGRQTHINLLISTTDYQAEQSEYDTMLEFVGSYPFFAHPDLRHTLFLTGDTYSEDPLSIQVGFPADWRAHWSSARETVIRPVVGSYNADFSDIPVIFVRLRRAFANLADIADIAQAYNIPENTLNELDDPACGIQIKVAEFNNGGRQGYISIYYEYLIEASTPEAQFAEYEAELRAVVDSVMLPFADSCG